MCLLVGPVANSQQPDLSRAGNEKVAEIMRTFAGRGVMSDGSEPTPATEAIKQFRLRDGFEIDRVADEPVVSQPLFLSWDSRGRMWVVQYRQYQFPAGLKVIRYDQHLRAVFDRVPDPPPHGTPGEDKITVFEDTDGDGQYDHHKDVITGLNIATSVQVGRGGIWVLNPPYLLFYPDADGDDVPDADPKVCLSGFGLQDTHSVANSLLWGPDGWLYGSNGSTTVGDVSSSVTKGVRFEGQCVWRYHPDTEVFEIYAEGGGNTFSLDIDAKGRVFTGTNGGSTRGYYFPQGSYSRKNWGKHGPLTNPYAFGFFPAMDLQGDRRRFAQAFCIYEGGLFEKAFDGMIIAPNALHNLVWASERIADGSTYRAVDTENLIETPDRWFRPVYGGVGPDGAFYLADWYDTRLSHVSPIDDWHKASGRVYRVRPSNSDPAYTEGDLNAISSEQLMAKFVHSNKWVRQRAVLELGWRGDKTVVDELVDRVDRFASLESLWTLNLLGELTDQRAGRWLRHSDPHIRRWVVRALGDQHRSHPGFATLAQHETEVQVRSQLASTARRIEASDAIPIIQALVTHDQDVDDPHMPLMNWWAIETHADAWASIQALIDEPTFWHRPLVREHLISRLMQRYAAAGSPADLEHCAALLQTAPDQHSRELLMVGLTRAFEGRSIPPLPDLLADAIAEHQNKLGTSGLVLKLRQGDAGALNESLRKMVDADVSLTLRIELTRVLGEVRHPKSVSTLLKLATGKGAAEPALQRVAIGALAQYDNDDISRPIIAGLGSSIPASDGLRDAACRMLASRTQWAKALLEELNQWRLRRDQVPADVVQQLRSYSDPEIVTKTNAVFGNPLASSSEQKLQQITELRSIVASGVGDEAEGKGHFTKRCATCHQLFGEGKKVGPPLDGYERGKLNFWLTAIVEPSLEIREGYQSYLVLSVDGRTVTGMIAAQDPKTVTLRNADNELTVISRDDIEVLKALPTSLMPEDVLKEMTDQQIRDLFAYLSIGAELRP
tara:strand:+ start:83133 stop:86147 length:3015 start_codon:yes stop_codon:yes gene_type:complete